MGQQIIDDLPVGVRIFPCGCPADYAKLVIIAFANGIRTVLNQETNDREELLFGGKVQWISIVSFAADIRISAAIEEKSHSRSTFSKNSVMQRGSYTWPAGFIDHSRICGEQRVELREIASARGILQ